MPFLPLFAALLMSLPLAAVAEPVAPPPIGFGIGFDGADAMAEAGVPADHLQTWAGWWNVMFEGLADELAEAERRNATLVIEWYYWGDPLRPDCWKTTCDGRTVEAWNEKTRTLARVLGASNASAIVVVESEFNKNGIADPEHAADFDAALAHVMRILHDGSPHTQVALGFGSWGFEQWTNFPRALAEADLVGLQAMAGSTRQDMDSYLATADKTLDLAQRANATFGKPVVVHDIALASYPAPEWTVPQAQAVQAFVDLAPAFAEAGVVALVYRAHLDAPQAGHFGAAEGAFGLATQHGEAKPSWWAWVGGVAAYRG